MTKEKFTTIRPGDILSNKTFDEKGSVMGWDYLVIGIGCKYDVQFIRVRTMWEIHRELQLGARYELFKDNVEEYSNLYIKFKNDL